jgi:hypothetical protein
MPRRLEPMSAPGGAKRSSSLSTPSASLDLAMRDQAEANHGRAANALAAFDCCLPRLRAGAPLGLGFGDRFEAFRGGSGVRKEGGLHPRETSRAAGKSRRQTAFRDHIAGGRSLNGKEGVDGSSPSEGFGFRNPLQKCIVWRFLLPAQAREGHVEGTLGNIRALCHRRGATVRLRQRASQKGRRLRCLRDPASQLRDCSREGRIELGW